MRWLVLFLFLAACGGPLSLLTGGGPNVAANVQAGKTNSQTVGATENRDVRQSVKQAESVQQSADETQVKTETVETLVIEQPVSGVWIVAFTLWSLFLFWLPSPGHLWKMIMRKS